MKASLEAAAGRPVSRETIGLIERYVALLSDDNEHQNLVAAASLSNVWERHILDSAQLTRFAPNHNANWADIGSGAGLPGLIIALLSDGPMTLIEPRRLRAEFLQRAVADLGLSLRVKVECASVQKVSGRFDLITARAVAPLGKLIGLAHHLSHACTIWVLPKGRHAKSELAEARRKWQCEARSEQSRTDPDSAILVLTNVEAKRPS